MSAELIESLFTIHMRKNAGLENPGVSVLNWASAGDGLHFLEAPGWSGRYHITCVYLKLRQLIEEDK